MKISDNTMTDGSVILYDNNRVLIGIDTADEEGIYFARAFFARIVLALLVKLNPRF
jgi:hypothetical protein